MTSSDTFGTSTLATLTTVVDNRRVLAASQCTLCNTVDFPFSPSCPCCGGSSIESTTLDTTGTLWTWTVQRFPPKPPYLGTQPFTPFAVGYVDLGVIRIESRLAGKAIESWQIGDCVRLVFGPLDASSADYQTFWFEPTGAS